MAADTDSKAEVTVEVTEVDTRAASKHRSTMHPRSILIGSIMPNTPIGHRDADCTRMATMTSSRTTSPAISTPCTITMSTRIRGITISHGRN